VAVADLAEEAVLLTAAAVTRHDDHLLDHSYLKTKLGPDVKAWLDWMELGGAADRTLDQYERDLAKLCTYFPDKPLPEITDADLTVVLNTYPKPSRRVRKESMRSFFKWAIRTRRVQSNPCDFLPEIKRTPQRYIDVFTEAEVDDLATLPVVDSALMMILVEAGLRKAEARALQVRRIKVALSEGVSDIPQIATGVRGSHPQDSPSESAGELVVIRGKGGKDRVIPIGHRLADTLAELLLLEPMEPQDFLWYSRPGGGRSISRARQIGDGSFDRWWKRCLDTAGVRYRNPHTARHTFATRWLRRGGRLETLSLVMGHASIQTTADLYAHLDTRDIAADVAVIGKERT
jgi:integrase/recombinase XerD